MLCDLMCWTESVYSNRQEQIMAAGDTFSMEGNPELGVLSAIKFRTELYWSKDDV